VLLGFSYFRARKKMQVPRYQGPAPHVLKRDTSEEKGEEARMSSFIGALALCDLVKTTLGPKVCVCVCVCPSLLCGWGSKNKYAEW